MRIKFDKGTEGDVLSELDLWVDEKGYLVDLRRNIRVSDSHQKNIHVDNIAEIVDVRKTSFHLEEGKVVDSNGEEVVLYSDKKDGIFPVRGNILILRSDVPTPIQFK